MGADLIGYWAIVPVVGTDAFVKSELKAIKKILCGDKGIEEITDGDFKLEDEVVEQLKRRGIEDSQDMPSPLEYLQAVVGYMEALKDFTATDFPYRDGTFAEMTVNGVKVRTLFAGEMSWGDEPDGSGYQVLKALGELGIESKLYKKIPWGAKKR